MTKFISRFKKKIHRTNVLNEIIKEDNLEKFSQKIAEKIRHGVLCENYLCLKCMNPIKNEIEGVIFCCGHNYHYECTTNTKKGNKVCEYCCLAEPNQLLYFNLCSGDHIETSTLMTPNKAKKRKNFDFTDRRRASTFSMRMNHIEKLKEFDDSCYDKACDEDKLLGRFVEVEVESKPVIFKFEKVDFGYFDV